MDKLCKGLIQRKPYLAADEKEVRLLVVAYMSLFNDYISLDEFGGLLEEIIERKPNFFKF